MVKLTLELNNSEKFEPFFYFLTLMHSMQSEGTLSFVDDSQEEKAIDITVDDVRSIHLDYFYEPPINMKIK
jgi:hypothetical protein